MGYALYIRCALSIHQKECRKSLGYALYIGARYLPENTVCLIQVQLDVHYILYFFLDMLALHVSGAICTHNQEHNCSVQR
jgi:hypothetical protein